MDDLSKNVHSKLVAAGWAPGVARHDSLLAWLRLSRRNIATTADVWRRFVSHFGYPGPPFGSFKGELDSCRSARIAQQILRELFLLEVRSGPTRYPTTIIFNPLGAIGSAPEIRTLGVHLGGLIVPVGEVLSMAHVLIANSGEVYVLDYIGGGLYYAGESFGTGMDTLLSDRLFRPVYIEGLDDPYFRLPEVTPDSPNVFCPVRAVE
ncbi:MAG: SUKH-3 domain-containing protein [Planctomycetaceae bacterium]|nr:SUKH-3 domain-containing protein [Planctomycetaceae bacterium]